MRCKEGLDFVVLFPESREAVPLVDINAGKKIRDIHDGCCAAFGEHLRKSFSANEIAGQAVSQICAISVVTHVRRDGGAEVSECGGLRLKSFIGELIALNLSVSGRLSFAGQVKYRSYLTETKRSQRKHRTRPRQEAILARCSRS